MNAITAPLLPSPTPGLLGGGEAPPASAHRLHLLSPLPAEPGGCCRWAMLTLGCDGLSLPSGREADVLSAQGRSSGQGTNPLGRAGRRPPPGALSPHLHTGRRSGSSLPRGCGTALPGERGLLGTGHCRSLPASSQAPEVMGSPPAPTHTFGAPVANTRTSQAQAPMLNRIQEHRL